MAMPNVNSGHINAEDYAPYVIDDAWKEQCLVLGTDPQGNTLGLGMEQFSGNVLCTLPDDGTDIVVHQIIQGLPRDFSLVMPVTEKELPGAVALLARTHALRVCTMGNVQVNGKDLPMEVARRFTLCSTFRLSPERNPAHKKQTSFSAAAYVSKTVAYWASLRGLIPSRETPLGEQNLWPLVAEMLSAISMHLSYKEAFEDIALVDWIHTHTAQQILDELMYSQDSFVRSVYLPEMDLQLLADIRIVLYRALTWIREHAEWQKGRLTGSLLPILDLAELREGPRPTAVLILLPYLGIDAPAWLGAKLAVLYAKIEIEILGNQAGRPVVLVVRDESLNGLTSLTALKDLLTDRPSQAQGRNTMFLVLMREEEVFFKKFGKDGMQAIFDNVGYFLLNQGLGNKFATHLSQRLGNTLVTLGNVSQSMAVQGGFMYLPSSLSASRAETIQPLYPAAALLATVRRNILLLIVNKSGPSSGKVLPVVDPTAFAANPSARFTTDDAILLLDEQATARNLSIVEGIHLPVPPTPRLSRQALSTARQEIRDVFPNISEDTLSLEGQKPAGFSWFGTLILTLFALVVIVGYLIGHHLGWW